MREVATIIMAYLAGSVLTAGYYLREVEWRKPRNAAIVGAVWPFYWLLIHGVSGTFTVILGGLLGATTAVLDGISVVTFGYLDAWCGLYAIGVLITAGVLIDERMSACSAVPSCVALVSQSLGRALLWPAVGTL